MTLRGPLTDRRADLIAERLRVLGQPLRVKLLDRLATQAITVQELVGSLETTQQNVSQHLGILQRAGIVARHKEGTRVRYELVDPHIVPLLERAESSLAHHLGQLTEQIKPGP
jgi:DNA-binding transcriptional ArsR family regulator